MSRSGNDRTSRTVANSPLQQSSFVFLPEEEAARREILKAPEVFRAEARRGLDLRREEAKGERAALAKVAETAARAAGEIGSAAVAFAGDLPQTVFGGADGSAFVLPFGILFERVREQQNVLGSLLLRLDAARAPGWFDPDRFLFVAETLGDGELRTATERARAEDDAIMAVIDRLSDGIGTFCETAVGAFYGKAADVFDLEHDGANARFGALRALCGELRHAAEQFAGKCRENGT